MGLSANIPAIEAAQALMLARGIGIAFGDPKGLAQAIYASTGNERLAQRMEITAQMEKARHV